MQPSQGCCGPFLCHKEPGKGRTDARQPLHDRHLAVSVAHALAKLGDQYRGRFWVTSPETWAGNILS